MKILWVVNILFPDVSKAMGRENKCYGGWLLGLADSLKEDDGFELSICTVDAGVQDVQQFNLNGIRYYVLPFNRKNIYTLDPALQDRFDALYRQIQPDLIHIHGTEFGHSLAAAKAGPQFIKVVAIQGLTSIYTYHYDSGIPSRYLQFPTLRDRIRRDSIQRQKKSFHQRGKIEKECLRLVPNVIGRTNWDAGCTKIINPERAYFKCNEILRKSFYSDHWEYEKAKPYRIFISQATYPIKGFHIFLKALALVKERYPQVDVTISGLPPFSTDAKGKILVTGYGKYLQSLIKKHDLSDVLHFIGEIDEQQMKQEFLACNVFVSASVIENESNSVSEAKILGVPVISSYVGGVAERICHLEDGILYPFEEFYMLAYYIMKLFEDVDLCKKISNNARVNARKINDPQKNISDLKRIYCKLIERGSNDHDS